MRLRTMPEVKAFLKHYAIGNQINHFLLTDKEQAKAMKTNMVQLKLVGNNVIWVRK